MRATPVAATPSLLELPNGETWEFETDAGELVVEESILMSDTRGNRQTDQLVIYGRVQRDPVGELAAAPHRASAASASG